MKGLLFPGAKSTRRETLTISHVLNLGITGAITTQSKLDGVSAARTAAGTYLFTFDSRYSAVLAVFATIKGANATYIGTAGFFPFIATGGDLINSATKTISVKMLDFAGAVAEVENGAVVLFEFDLVEVPVTVG